MSALADVTNTLAVDDRARWEAYVRLELDGVRREAIRALAELMPRLKSYSPREREVFVLALTAAARTPDGPSFPLRHPLFSEVVLPVLLERYDSGVPGSARILFDFRSLIAGGNLSKEAIGERDVSPGTLLDRAILDEPNARDLQLRWLAMNQSWFEFATHEVPSGVLYENSGATVTQCEQLLGEVAQFETRATKLGVVDEHREAIAEWRYYFSSYRDYLVHRDDYDSFAQFLEMHPFVTKGSG